MKEGTEVPSFIGTDLNKLAGDIAKIVEDNLPDESYFLVDLAVKGARGQEKVVILIDGDRGIDIETCSRISRVVSEELDQLDILTDRYTLEVSSPGVDFPLISVRQYKKNIGKQMRILLHDNKNIHGELLHVDDQGIMIRNAVGGKKKSPENISIPFGDIKKAKVLVTFK